MVGRSPGSTRNQEIVTDMVTVDEWIQCAIGPRNTMSIVASAKEIRNVGLKDREMAHRRLLITFTVLYVSIGDVSTPLAECAQLSSMFTPLVPNSSHGA